MAGANQKKDGRSGGLKKKKTVKENDIAGI